MEIKYLAVFGPQELFEGMMDDCEFIVGTYGYKIKEGKCFYCERHNQKYGWAQTGDAAKALSPVIAMRRIIKTQVIGYDESEFEDELEALYWHFDTDKKTGARSERDIFKGKVRYLINKFTQPKKTPVWTVADQQAGRLPEVGALVKPIASNPVPFLGVDRKDHKLWVFQGGSGFVFSCLAARCEPIESPEEKAARLREEWCERALKLINKEISDSCDAVVIYDALLSGKLPMPSKGE